MARSKYSILYIVRDTALGYRVQSLLDNDMPRAMYSILNSARLSNKVQNIAHVYKVQGGLHITIGARDVYKVYITEHGRYYRYTTTVATFSYYVL